MTMVFVDIRSGLLESGLQTTVRWSKMTIFSHIPIPYLQRYGQKYSEWLSNDREIDDRERL